MEKYRGDLPERERRENISERRFGGEKYLLFIYLGKRYSISISEVYQVLGEGVVCYTEEDYFSDAVLKVRNETYPLLWTPQQDSEKNTYLILRPLKQSVSYALPIDDIIEVISHESHEFQAHLDIEIIRFRGKDWSLISTGSHFLKGDKAKGGNT